MFRSRARSPIFAPFLALLLALSAVFVSGFGSPAAAAQVSTTGLVVDSETDTGIEGVTVSIGVNETSTDADGNYFYTFPDPGTYELVFTAPGYVTTFQDIPITAETSTLPTIEMTRTKTMSKPPVWSSTQSRTPESGAPTSPSATLISPPRPTAASTTPSPTPAPTN